MAIEDCFQIQEEARTAFIEKNIVGKLPENVKESTRGKATEIVTDYVGQDLNALSVLAYAAERGRFDEFAGKLEEHYKKSLQYVHPEARRIAQVPGAVRAESFFIECYQSLDIKPSSN